MTGLGLAVGLAAWIFGSDVRVPLVSVAIFGSVAVILGATLTHAVLVAHAAALKRLPRVRIAKVPPSSYRDVRVVLLLDESELFSVDALVAVYKIEDEDYEALVAIGRVLIIQDSGLIQIGVTNILPEAAESFEKVLRNEKSALKALIVKPHVPVSVYGTTFGELT